MFHCYRNRFTQAQFDTYRLSFWAMPPEWVSQPTGEPWLSRIWREGHKGALSILPILGQHALTTPKGLELAFEELARLTRTSVKTVANGARMLEQFRFVRLGHSPVKEQPGRQVTRWDVDKSISAKKEHGRLEVGYFYFPARLVYGGNWAMLSPVQRLVYLGLGSMAKTFEEGPITDNVLEAALRGGPQEDMKYGEGGLRLATASYPELAARTGATERAINDAIQQFKNPAQWPGVQNDAEWLRYSPLAVYKASGGHRLIYHFRDHAPPWPWDRLNAMPTSVRENADSEDHLELVA